MQLYSNKRGQLTIFIIVALVIVGGIVTYLLVRDNLGIGGNSAEFKPVYDSYLGCVKEKTSQALQIAGTQGGRIYLDDYIPGSEYSPFSSQLNFLGNPVPYWYYVSGNGLITENVPTKAQMEEDISKYVKNAIEECDLSSFSEQGYVISLGKASVKSSISDSSVSVSVNQNINVAKGEDSTLFSSSNVVVDSKIGKFYNLAKTIYAKEKSEAFLENYSADVLRLYAPVDGVDLSCAPKIWRTREIVDELKQGLSANIASLKFKGGDYSLSDKKSEYYVIDQSVDENVGMMYSANWPTRIQIQGDGVQQELMIAKPVGNQQGMGMMGFCYAPYHYVYDLSYPVLIQIYNGDEIFQFPVVVVIDKNLPRNGIYTDLFEQQESVDICAFRDQSINVNVYDVNLNPIDGNVSYKCFDQICSLGSTTGGVFSGGAQSCVNGELIVNAEGYAEKKKLFSSNSETSVDVILDREYGVNVSVALDGKKLNGNAIVSFVGDNSYTFSLPDLSEANIAEGLYNVSVYVYGNSSIVIPTSTKSECVDVPNSGISGIFGGSHESCYDINLPETKVESALIGGGKGTVYLLPSDLEKGEIVVQADSLPQPKSIEDLQNNYQAFDGLVVNLEFK